LIQLGRATFLSSRRTEELMMHIIDDMVLVKRETLEKLMFPNIINNVDECLARITVPSMMVIAAKDVITTSKELQHKTIDALPVSKKVVYSDEGHYLPYENPKRLAIEVEAFVRQVAI
jgi:pimeloyl-ACP methyl ester carboxylesterase